MLFVQKTELQFMVCVARRGLGYWTGALIDARGGGLTWCIEAWGVGGRAGTVQPGRRGWLARTSSIIWKPKAFNILYPSPGPPGAPPWLRSEWLAPCTALPPRHIKSF